MNGEMIPVSSSNIEAIGYDSDAEILYVSFLKGGKYEYLNVPSHIHEGIMNASSKGVYLNQNVKGIYPDQKIG